MNRCVQSDRGKNQRIISQIGEKEYLIEGFSEWGRFGCQVDPSILTSVQLEGGPFLLVGDSFLGKGNISAIQHIESDQDNYFILKITLH